MVNSNDMNILDEIKSEVYEKEQLINEFEDKVKLQDEEISFKDAQITGFNSQLSLKESQIKNFESKLINKEIEINELNNQLKLKENEFDSIKQQYIHQLAKLDNKEYCVSCFKEEIKNNHLEIQYLKNESIAKKLLSPFAYIYLLFKSQPKELSLNYKLYKALKNSKCFDIGFYLNNNKDIMNSRWCKYFSPELHYVCNGFNEKRKFNNKYFNTNSKKELFDYLLKCDE